MRARVVSMIVVMGCAAPAPAREAVGPAAVSDAAPAVVAAPPDAAIAVAIVPPDPRVDAAAAAAILVGGEVPAACATRDDAIACMIERAYAADAKAQALAIALHRDTGDVAGLGATEDMDGGFRGTIHLVPELPIAGYRRHLEWVAGALRDYDDFFARLSRDPVRYRWRDLQVRFVRSVRKHTPSAFALPWTVSYNVEGSLLKSADAVRETLFHEIFHMNDADHGDWSATALRADYQAIIARCGTARESTPCLAPFAPSETKVKKATYYAFQQNNGDPVHEYAAELALRYYREQREMERRGRLSRKAFKCGPPENARSWDALATEFFGGRDLVPACK